MSEKEIKPCPFCGEKPYLKENTHDWTYYKYEIYCAKGKCRINPHTRLQKSKEEAIKAWNKRA